MRPARASTSWVPMDNVNPSWSRVTAVSFWPQSEPPIAAASGAVQDPSIVNGPAARNAVKLHTAPT